LDIYFILFLKHIYIFVFELFREAQARAFRLIHQKDGLYDVLGGLNGVFDSLWTLLRKMHQFKSLQE
jgi:hypothetical protein